MNTNALTQHAVPSTAVNSASAGALLMDMQSMDRLERLAELMASGRTTMPDHIRTKGDCFAIALQSMQWGMNPFAVAQKTHVVSGKLGYEGQLVAAVINTSKVVIDRFHFDWYGPWEKVIGKFVIKKGDKGEYRVPGWAMADEEGCGIRVWATLRGEAVPRTLDLLLAQARVRNSTLWADDPKQQLAYLAQKKWARLYAPDVILGVYTPDELSEPDEKFMGQVERVDPAASAGPATLPPYPADKFSLNLPKWRAAIATGKATAGAVIDKASTVGVLSAAQEQAIRAPLEPAKQAQPQQPPPSVTDVQPKGEAAPQEPEQAQVVTEQQVGDRMHRAATLDDLYTAADLIGEVADPEARARLTDFFGQRQFALEAE